MTAADLQAAREMTRYLQPDDSWEAAIELSKLVGPLLDEIEKLRTALQDAMECNSSECGRLCDHERQVELNELARRR